MSIWSAKISIRSKNRSDLFATLLFGVLKPLRQMIKSFICKLLQKYKSRSQPKENKEDKHLPQLKKRVKQRKKLLTYSTIAGQSQEIRKILVNGYLSSRKTLHAIKSLKITAFLDLKMS